MTLLFAGIIDQAASLQDGCDSICSFCSRMKRGRLYACARREGYNVLAMGQHLDDLTERCVVASILKSRNEKKGLACNSINIWGPNNNKCCLSFCHFGEGSSELDIGC